MSLLNKKIKSVYAYEVLDSRGFPTVACIVKTTSKVEGKAMVPSGASTGEREALELRDGDKKRYNGKGVLKAVDNINKIIAPALIGQKVTKQALIDQIMLDLDGTPGKSKLGANAILAVSLAACRAASVAKNVPLYKHIRSLVPDLKKNPEFQLPLPMLNVINGGAHADNTIDFQEFMFMPVGAKSIKQAVQWASECFHMLQKLLKEKKMDTNKGDEGGFAPNLKSADDALSIMVDAIKKAGYKPGINAQVAIALDPACSELYDAKTKTYVFHKAIKAKILSKTNGVKTTDAMIKYWSELVKKYPIISIEDGLSEKDWDGFVKMTQVMGAKTQIVGDDLYCTNPKILSEGIERKATNSILIKVNQIGSLSETFAAMTNAYKAGFSCVVSHRSGETEDTFIADLAVGMNSGQIKTGSMSRSERIAKYNRLIEIEDELKGAAVFKGRKTFTNLK